MIPSARSLSPLPVKPVPNTPDRFHQKIQARILRLKY